MVILEGIISNFYGLTTFHQVKYYLQAFVVTKAMEQHKYITGIVFAYKIYMVLSKVGIGPRILEISLMDLRMKFLDKTSSII